MANRLKRVLVESFVGAIGLGYLLAQVVLYFVNVLTSPIASWATRNIYRGLLRDSTALSVSPLVAAIAPAIAFTVLLFIWYLLLRWLYFAPLGGGALKPNPENTEPVAQT